MSAKGRKKSGVDPLEQYRKERREEEEWLFHQKAEKEDPYDWRKRPSKPESRNKKLVRKLGTTGQIISNKATTGDERTRYQTRNGVTWRVTKTREQLKKEAQEAAEREELRKKRSRAHKNDKGRPYYTRYLIKLNLIGERKSYYYGGDEIGWTTYECGIQYLGKKAALRYARTLISVLGLEDKSDKFDSIEVITIPPELNKEWLYAENMIGIMGRRYEEETYETHEEYVRNAREYNQYIVADCSNCICNNCGRRNPIENGFCKKCYDCNKQKNNKEWKDECERYFKVSEYSLGKLV